MSHSVSFGEARTIPTMEFCHSETSGKSIRHPIFGLLDLNGFLRIDPDSAACATFIFYYRSRALLEANGYIKGKSNVLSLPLPNDLEINQSRLTKIIIFRKRNPS